MNDKKFVPFHIDLAKKSPERIIFNFEITEVFFPKKTDVVIIIDIHGGVSLFNYKGYNLDELSRTKGYNLTLLAKPNKITKTYQLLYLRNHKLKVATIEGQTIEFAKKSIELTGTINSKAIQETTYNHTTGEISIKIVHKY